MTRRLFVLCISCLILRPESATARIRLLLPKNVGRLPSQDFLALQENKSAGAVCAIPRHEAHIGIRSQQQLKLCLAHLNGMIFVAMPSRQVFDLLNVKLGQFFVLISEKAVVIAASAGHNGQMARANFLKDDVNRVLGRDFHGCLQHAAAPV